MTLEETFFPRQGILSTGFEMFQNNNKNLKTQYHCCKGEKTEEMF